MQKFHKILIFSFLSIIIIYGLFLRFYKIGEQSYWIDEGYTLNAVLSTLEKGYPLLDSGEVYRQNNLLNNYIIAGAIKLGGFNPTTTRMPALIFGLGVIIIIYLLSKKFFNPLVGLGAAFLTTFSYWEIAWSRQARMYIQLQFFFLLALYIFNSLLDKFSYKKLVWLILITGAAILSHYFGYFLLGIYALILLFNFLDLKKEQRKEFFKDKKKILIASLSGITIIVFLIKLGADLFSQLQNRNFFLGLDYQNFLWTSLPVIIISALLGIVIAVLKEKNLKNTLSLIIAYLLPYLIIVFSADTLHFRYLFFILPILFIFSSYFIYFLAKQFKYPLTIASLLLIALIISSNLINPNAFIFKPRVNYYLETHTPQPDFKVAYQAIREQGWNNDKVIISSFTQLDKVYLGRSDYWLAIDLLGRPLNIADLNEREYYNNALTISDENQLKEIMDSHSGYIVVDDMARIRLNKDIDDLISKQKLIFSNKSGSGDRIWVLSF